MKKIGNVYYAKVDVKQCGSFMVSSDIDMHDDDVLSGCLNNDLLDIDEIPLADVDTFIDESDLKHFTSCTFNIL